jgi:F-type H+-transporting ATPase subunit epsilon
LKRQCSRLKGCSLVGKLRLEIVTAERLVYSEAVDKIVAPGLEGQFTVLPQHAALLSALGVGELLITTNSDQAEFAIGGGFLEVLNDKVIVLADSAERSDEIDLDRAQAAIRRAQELIATHKPDVDLARAEAALRRALLRIKVAEHGSRRVRGQNSGRVQ